MDLGNPFPQACLTVRRFEADDLDAVIAVFQRAVRGLAAADYSPAQVEAWSRVDRAAWSVPPVEGRRWVAWAGEEAAGFVDLGPAGHLAMLYVDPDHARRGIARALLATAEAAARDDGQAGLHAEVSLTARPVFDAAGFRVIAEERVMRGGQAFRRYRMCKDGLSA